MPTWFQAGWTEPRAPGATGPSWRDWVLTAVITSSCIAEGVLSEEVTWRPLTVALHVALALTLPWRRVHPLRTVTLAFGGTALLQSLALAGGLDWKAFDTALFLLILPYALLRWASGREVALGLAAIAFAFAVAVPSTDRWSEGVGAALFLLFPAALGAAARYRDSARRHAVEQVRLGERERLARELHDTVAHHVSAIAVQAQAGRVLARTRPEVPLETLAVIEEAASRALAEMRHIVRALREDEENACAPGATLSDVERLASEERFPLRVDVVLTGTLDDLDATLGSTLYRVVREALTNAVRHARGARTVNVHVTGESTRVHLHIADDGDTVTVGKGTGFGLRGMRERVALLGGTLSAGPGHAGGWIVEATLPKRSGSS